jgi:hypothetical protein
MDRPGGAKIIALGPYPGREESDMSDVKYYCSVCQKEISVKPDDAIPVCCGREMAPLPFCTTAPNPEMARNYDADEPCDPGTLPRKHK